MNNRQLSNRERYATLLIGNMLEGNDYQLKSPAYAEALNITPLPHLVAVKTDGQKRNDVLCIAVQWVASEDEAQRFIPQIQGKILDAKNPSEKPYDYLFAIVLGQGKKLYVSKGLKDKLVYDEQTVDVQNSETI